MFPEPPIDEPIERQRELDEEFRCPRCGGEGCEDCGFYDDEEPPDDGWLSKFYGSDVPQTNQERLEVLGRSGIARGANVSGGAAIPDEAQRSVAQRDGHGSSANDLERSEKGHGEDPTRGD